MKIKKLKNKDILVFEEAEVHEATIEDEEKAYLISGESRGYAFSRAIIAQCCTFDGKKLVAEDLKKMRRDDFLYILTALGVMETSDTPADESQDFADTQNLAMPKSKK